MRYLAFILLFFFVTSCATQGRLTDGSANTEEGLEVSEAIDDSKDQQALIEEPEPVDKIETDGDDIEIIRPSKRSYKSDVMAAFKSKDERGLKNLVSSKLAEEPNDLYSLNTLGAHHFRKGATKLARMIWDRALKEHPNSDTLLNNLGATFQDEDEEKAVRFYKRALKANSRNPYANFNLGSIYAKYKNFSMAETTLKIAYNELKTIQAANNYAIALRGNGKLKDSIKVYERIIRSKSDHYQALLNYATALVNLGGNEKKAKDALNKVRLLVDDRSILNYVQKLEQRMEK